MKNILKAFRKASAGAAAAALLTGAGLGVDGLLLKFTGLSVEHSAWLLLFVAVLGGAVSGFAAGAAAGRRGLFAGALGGLIYAAAVAACFLWLLGSCRVSMVRMLLFLIPVAAGAAGGFAGAGAENRGQKA